MVKLASNAFLATKISFINEIANVCEETGADVLEVARGMGLDDRIGPKFLQAGIGFGGSCFPKDVSALKQLAGNSGYHFQLLNAVIEVNELQKRRVMSKLQKHLGSLVGKEVALLGLAFKPNTDDMREASSLVLAARLQADGRDRARVRPGRRGGGAQAAARRRLRDSARGGRRGRRRRRARHRVARVRATSTRRGGRARCAARSSSTGATCSTPTPSRAAGLDLRGHRAPERRRAPARGGGRSLMQALILAGGEGTRLRPLTSTVPKPVVPLVDRPFIAYMLDWLRGHGVDDVVISCGFMAAGVRNVLGDGSAFGVRLRYVEEPQPMGTGGALKFAEPLLDERFLMLNGDVLTDIDLTARSPSTRRTGARATLALTPVEDPSAYGLVRHDERRRASTEFVEKPAPDQIDTNLDHRRRLRARARRARPARARRSRRRSSATSSRSSSATASTATWPRATGSTSGRPSATSQATFDILEGTVETDVARAHWATATSCVEQTRREPRARSSRRRSSSAAAAIGEGARVGGRVVLGQRREVGENTTIERAVVLRGAEIGANCTLRAASSAAARASATAPTSRASPCSARASRSAPTT